MTPSNSLIILVLSGSLFFFAIGKEEFVHKTNEEAHHYHTFQPSSLLPSSSCIPSAKGDKKTGLLEVVHKHGPCSKFSKDMVKPLTVEEIFTHDQSRVDSIRDRLTTKKGKTDALGSKTTLPAKSGRIIGSGNYIVTVGLGTPKKDLSVVFDTGSDLTWTQCKPCVVYCYKQQQPIFAPSKSSTYSNISCTSTECAGFLSAPGVKRGCSSTTCLYRIQYLDGSFSIGFFGKDKLTITSKDIVNDFHFGCGQDNQGLFRGAAGLLGLGRDKLSIVSQTATQYGKVFSYCLPSTSSTTGYLTFGSSGVSSNVKYTPISTSQRASSLYGLDLEAIFVGGTKLAISPMVFKSSGMIIDSGTVITRLPPTAYSALRKAFRAQMAKYKLTKPVSIFDTCYDFTNTPTVKVPIISFLWGGNTLVKTAAPSGIFIANGISQVCLAYAPNDDDSQIGIFGNTQQKTLQVVYDVKAGKVGFAQGGCA